jgi:hypothetical protein
VLRLVPETKGLSVEEITELFEQQAAERAAATPTPRPRLAHPRAT